MTGSRAVWMRSVRVRTTAGAVLVVVVTVSAGAVLLIGVLRGVLTDEIASAARSRAMEIAGSVHVAGTGGGTGIVVGDLEEDVAQVVAFDGSVLAASPNVTGLPPLVWPLSLEPMEVVGPVDAEPLVVIGQPVSTDTRLVVLVGRTVEARDDVSGLVAQLMAFGLPVLVTVVGFLCWKVVGRALRPVEAVRREVDEISAAALDHRVTVPPGADEITRLSATMNRMLDRLERAQLQQRRFTSDAAHELRSPVTAIRQYAEVALRHPELTSVSDLARTVLGEDLRVQYLVDDLLLLSRVDERILGPDVGPVDLDDLVFEEAGRLRRTTTLTVDTAAVSAGRVDGDRAALHRVVRNLGENAGRHARSRIAFSLREDDDGVTLLVDDDGPGIPESERGRVVQRFVRLDEARSRDGGGSGLGLAIVAEVVALHGGRVHIDRNDDGGARFQLMFPPDG
jgi:signal transduction histidine kinase